MGKGGIAWIGRSRWQKDWKERPLYKENMSNNVYYTYVINGREWQWAVIALGMMKFQMNVI